MINPYISYLVSLVVCLTAYATGWSTLYPDLTAALLAFLGTTAISHLLFSIIWNKKSITIDRPELPHFNPLHVTLFIYALWIADFAYEGGVPLIKILTHQPYNYRLFGIPSLHVFTVTFASFYTTYLFFVYTTTKEKFLLWLYLANLTAALLIYSRAMLMFNITSSVFIYFLCSPVLSLKRIGLLSAAFIALMFIFGVLGTLRVSFESKQTYNPDLFLATGRASESFRTSGVPPEFFWGYIYLSSPIANLQENINTFDVPNPSAARIAQHLSNEMLFDFISKRTNALFGIQREEENNLRNTPFNVSTVYSRSFSYQSWTGMSLMAVFVLVVPLIYRQFIRNNKYQIVGMAILNTMYLFLFYDNTIRFTGLGLQLIYPFLLPMFERFIVTSQKKSAI